VAPSTEQPAVAGGKRALASLLGGRHIRLALVVLAVANLAMVGMMAVAPVHLHDHGAGMGTIGLLISAYIAAMYLPSPVTGWLADALGGRVVAGMGALLLLAAGAAAAVAGSGRGGIVVALLLLGVGWNAGLIGGSALLHDAAVSPSLRTRAEGLGELGMASPRRWVPAAPGCRWPAAVWRCSAWSRPPPACWSSPPPSALRSLPTPASTSTRCRPSGTNPELRKLPALTNPLGSRQPSPDRGDARQHTAGERRIHAAPQGSPCPLPYSGPPQRG
jgi:hypothetical protein